MTERILTKSRAMEYLTLDGLTKMTGVTPAELDVYALKEIVDNGLDAAEVAGRLPALGVSVFSSADQLTLEITDNGTGVSAEMVREVTNLERFGGTKYFIKKPTRGAQGNALMTIIGLIAALWREHRGGEAPAMEDGYHRTVLEKYEVQIGKRL